jgi:hypothetical protein
MKLYEIITIFADSERQKRGRWFFSKENNMEGKHYMT